MRRTASYVVFGIGLLVLVAGIIKVLPGGIGTGAAGLAFGIILFALSFIRPPAVEADSEPPLPAFERIAGLFYMPGAVFRNMRTHPRWLVALLIVTIISSAYSIAFTKRITPERMAAQVFDKLKDKGWMPPEVAEKQKQDQVAAAKSPVMVAEGVLKSFVGGFVLTGVVAAIFLLLVLVFGGRMNYWQAFAVTINAALPAIVIKKVLSFVLLYLKDPADVHPLLGNDSLVQDNLGILFSPSEHPALFIFASIIGVLSIYTMWLNATGLRQTGNKVSSGAAWTATLVVFIGGAALAAIWTSIFPVL